MIHANLLKIKAGTSQESAVFKASHGWFDNFKKRPGIHCVVRHGKGANADKDAAKDFVKEFGKFVETEGLFWKKMPNRTYITQEEKALPGHKPMKNRLTLLFCGNASEDCKLKPLLIYHSENPRAFKKHNVQKTQLPVMWRSSSKAWVTREYFSEWFNVVFGPSVKSYLEETSLLLKALLIMDNAPAHPPSLQDYMLPEFDFITVKFLPPNTTPPIQPMDQQLQIAKRSTNVFEASFLRNVGVWQRFLRDFVKVLASTFFGGEDVEEELADLEQAEEGEEMTIEYLDDVSEGNNTTVFNLYNKIDAFKKKLILWNKRTQEDNYDMFDSLSDFINSEDLDVKCVNHIVCEHLQALSCAFNEYYPPEEDRRIGNTWIMNPFIDQKTNRLNDFEQEKLIELSSDLMLKTVFESVPVTQFWIKVKTEYPVLYEKAMWILLPFSTTYLCESTFSAMALIKSKQQNRLCYFCLTPCSYQLKSKN
ncbi:hypothetical protein CBL_10016 [Carabus blaptoides fortunei]